MKKKSLIITGAAGFVGRNLLPVLINHGYKPTALVKSETEKQKLAHLKIDVITADLSEAGNWQEKIKCDVLIHLASEISAKQEGNFKKNNVDATRNLITAARKNKVEKIIHFSSAAVTSIRQDPYSKTKKEQEQLIKNSGLKYFVLRPSMIYGPTDDKNVGWLIKTLEKLPVIPLPGGGFFGRQPVYVEDICKIVINLIESKKQNKIYEIHGYEYVTMKDMVSEIKKTFKMKQPTIVIPLFVLKLFIFLNQSIMPNPKFTTDQIDSLTSGEKFKGDDWAGLFDIIPTKFSQGIEKMKY